MWCKSTTVHSPERVTGWVPARMALAVLSIAVVGKHGNPLFLGSYSSRHGGQADLKWHYAAHTALDYFDERELPQAKTTESYLGLLYAMEDYAVYGYQTNTRVKFILALSLADAVIRDVDVKTIFRAIHNSYITYLSNPFTSPANDNPAVLAPPIRSPKFEKAMATIAGRPTPPQDDA